jgi:hypothetical protein
MAELDPQSTRRRRAARRAGSRGGLAYLASAATVTREQAAHVIWLLASFDVFDLLSNGRGLTAATAAILEASAAGGVAGCEGSCRPA